MNETNPLSVGKAQALVASRIHRLAVETVSLEAATGRVLAEDVAANRDLPPYDVSAMDGFAVRSADLAGEATALSIIEDIKAGGMPRRRVEAGQCARIMTGAPVPAGADAVIRVEDSEMLVDGKVAFSVRVKAGNDIRRQGEAMRCGSIVLKAGSEITPGVVGVLATVKKATVAVYRRPRVAILSSGDELEALDAPFNANKIPESNSYAVMAQLQAIGVEPVRLGIAADNEAELAAYLERGLDFDVLLVSGGSSVGVHDLVRPVLEQLGVEIHFWRVEMRPGHPLVFGSRKHCLVFGLPGNPVSSMVCVEQFVLPALRQMMGNARPYRTTVVGRLAHPVKHRPGRAEFIRVALGKDACGEITVSATGSQSSGDLTSMAAADGLLVVPAGSEGLAAGGTVQVQLLDGGEFQAKSGFEVE